MRWLIALALLAVPTDADACSISGTPAAHVFQAAGGQPPGRKPFITLWRAPGTIAITQVPASCKAKSICQGTDVPYDRNGKFVRPKKSLPDGARIQITSGKTLLGDATVGTGFGLVLAAGPLGTFSIASSGIEKEGLCSPAGPAVHVLLTPAKQSTEGVVFLFYLQKPDLKQPLANLVDIQLADAGSTFTLGNHLGEDPWLKTVPKKLWVIAADGEGNLGSIVEIK